jgi:capsular exopolysaccharide synthesis family protein
MFRRKNAGAPPPGDDLPTPEEMVVLVDRAVNPYLVFFHEPTGFRAEQIRGLRNKLVAMNPDGAAKTLVVSSAIKGEGKTVTAINLALAFAEIERSPVLLVEGDLRTSAIERYLNLNPGLGLSDVLLGRCGLEAAIKPSGVRNLELLGAGTRLASPSEVLTTPRIEELFARLKERYQYAVIDTPPSLAATDASVLAARADGVLFVVRLEHSPRALARDAVRTLQELGANVLGTFVTEVRGADPETDPRLAYSRPQEE